MKRIKTRSGLSGWQQKLRKVYRNFEEFLWYCEIYGISQRLGYSTPKAAWRWNPTMQGSVNPSDCCKVYRNGRRIYQG